MLRAGRMSSPGHRAQPAFKLTQWQSRPGDECYDSMVYVWSLCRIFLHIHANTYTHICIHIYCIYIYIHIISRCGSDTKHQYAEISMTILCIYIYIYICIHMIFDDLSVTSPKWWEFDWGNHPQVAKNDNNYSQASAWMVQPSLDKMGAQGRDTSFFCRVPGIKWIYHTIYWEFSKNQGIKTPRQP